MCHIYVLADCSNVLASVICHGFPDAGLQGRVMYNRIRRLRLYDTGNDVIFFKRIVVSVFCLAAAIILSFPEDTAVKFNLDKGRLSYEGLSSHSDGVFNIGEGSHHQEEISL